MGWWVCAAVWPAKRYPEKWVKRRCRLAAGAVANLQYTAGILPNRRARNVARDELATVIRGSFGVR